MKKPTNRIFSGLIEKGGTAALLSLTGLLMVFAIMVLVPKPSLGNEIVGHRPSPEKMMERLSARLQLTPAQQQAVGPIITKEIRERRKVMQQFRSEAETSHQQLRQEMEKIDRDTATELGAILTPVQMEEYGRLQEKIRNRMAERRRDRRPRGAWQQYNQGGQQPPDQQAAPPAEPPADQPQSN